MLWTQQQLAEFLQVSERTLERWRSEQQGPPFIQLVQDGKVRYRTDDVESWLEGQRVKPMRSYAALDDGRIVESWQSRKAQDRKRAPT